MLANLVSALQLGSIIFAFFGDYIFQALKIDPPAFYHTFKEKKTFIMIGVFFGGNMLSQQLTATGAFEVILNGKNVRERSFSFRSSLNLRQEKCPLRNMCSS